MGLFFRFYDVNIFAGFTHIILFAGNLFDLVFIGFQPFDLPVVVVGRIVLCRNLLPQVVDLPVVTYPLDATVFVDKENENDKYDQKRLPQREVLAYEFEYFLFIYFHRSEMSITLFSGKSTKNFWFDQWAGLFL